MASFVSILKAAERSTWAIEITSRGRGRMLKPGPGASLTGPAAAKDAGQRLGPPGFQEPALRGGGSLPPTATIASRASTCWRIEASAALASADGDPAAARRTSASTNWPIRTLAGVAPQSVRNASQVSSSTATRATRAPGDLTRRFDALRSSGSCGRLEARRLRFRAMSRTVARLYTAPWCKCVPDRVRHSVCPRGRGASTPGLTYPGCVRDLNPDKENATRPRAALRSRRAHRRGLGRGAVATWHPLGAVAERAQFMLPLRRS
jgi:hypothetical protein